MTIEQIIARQKEIRNNAKRALNKTKTNRITKAINTNVSVWDENYFIAN